MGKKGKEGDGLHNFREKEKKGTVYTTLEEKKGKEGDGLYNFSKLKQLQQKHGQCYYFRLVCRHRPMLEEREEDTQHQKSQFSLNQGGANAFL
ncbi:MAG: hypothetical protein QME81_01265 [bacterium]|nr:hypothetical protein [bacterium]